ncbi:hypothetical protein LCGC14_0743070 [marine sediment metagenome]|uniref:Homing endonuclease LAGLIDADG domain-containing protein n=1 Tax=marine sediment metagenome TaxID=412755 RepID=A0A0F9TD92_9ZZZZ
MISDGHLGWAAGIIDGEGCISARSTYRRGEGKEDYWTLSVEVINTDIRILERLQDSWGGSIYKRKNYNPERHNDAWCWTVRGHVACRLLSEIRVWMVSKGEQADLALEFGNLLNEDNKPYKLSEENLKLRRGLAVRIQELKKRK